jgi:hypothetical protein
MFKAFALSLPKGGKKLLGARHDPKLDHALLVAGLSAPKGGERKAVIAARDAMGRKNTMTENAVWVRYWRLRQEWREYTRTQAEHDRVVAEVWKKGAAAFDDAAVKDWVARGMIMKFSWREKD